MSGKKVGFGAPRKQQRDEQDPDNWVKDRSAEAKPKMKRLTLDLPEDLHRKIKVSSAERGTRMVEDIREILEAHYRD